MQMGTSATRLEYLENAHQVDSEIGRLRRIIIHAPDPGIGIFPPSVMHDLLYDDIVDYDKICSEYSEYLELLYWFLDPEKMRNLNRYENRGRGLSAHFDPTNEGYLRSNNVMDVQDLLVQGLSEKDFARDLVAAICGLEGLGAYCKGVLSALEPRQLAATLVSGMLPNKNGVVHKIFAPITNLIFTRDTAVSIGEHLFVTKPENKARARESLILQYVLHEIILQRDDSKLLQLDMLNADLFPDSRSKITIEGGDMMMIAPNHLLVGFTTRTNQLAIDALIKLLLNKNIVEKVSVICLPHARDFMHIDTVFTQVKRGVWALFGPFSKRGYELYKGRFLAQEIVPQISTKKVRIFQYSKANNKVQCRPFEFLDDLLSSISKDDLGHKGSVEFVYCAGGHSALEEREQWMDGCNFLALREGVILGYDRNKLTTASFAELGFQIIDGVNLNRQLRDGADFDDIVIGDALILLPSSELSRARGGTHCMSLPVCREKFI